jgi:hypothetical protein
MNQVPNKLWSEMTTAEAVFAVLCLCAFVYSLTWVYDDARRLGKPGWLVVLIVAVGSWPVALIAWFFFRPEQSPPPPQPSHEEPLNCLKCRSAIPAGLSECEQCGWSYKRRDT